MLPYLLLIPLTFAASIPPQPSIPTSSACLQKCFESASIIQGIADLANFRSVVLDIEEICSVNTAVLKCGRECPEADIAELEARTAISSFVCAEKIEEFRLSRECLTQTTDVVESCMQDCKMSGVPLRLDSSPAAQVNPTALMEGVDKICLNHICSISCGATAFNKACPGTGELFRDLAREEARIGSSRLIVLSETENSTQQKMALAYLTDLPEQCAIMKDPMEFDKIIPLPLEGEVTESTETAETTEITETQTTGQTETSETQSSSTEISPSDEIEPSNEPEVPVGPPEEGATVEPATEVEGQEETDEEIIGSDGRKKQPTTPTVEGDATVVTVEDVAKEEPVNDVEGEHTTVAGETSSIETTDAVIVIDDENKEAESNDVATEEAAVKSSSISMLGAAMTAFIAIRLLC